MSLRNGRSIGENRSIVKRAIISYTMTVISLLIWQWRRLSALPYQPPLMTETLYPIRLYIKYQPNMIMMSVALAMNLAMWGWLMFHIHPQSDQLFLHYTILFGVDLIGSWNKIFFLPISGFLIIVVNALIGWLMFKSDKFFAQILNAVALFCQVLLLIGTWLVVYLNV